MPASRMHNVVVSFHTHRIGYWWIESRFHGCVITRMIGLRLTALSTTSQSLPLFVEIGKTVFTLPPLRVSNNWQPAEITN